MCRIIIKIYSEFFSITRDGKNRILGDLRPSTFINFYYFIYLFVSS